MLGESHAKSSTYARVPLGIAAQPHGVLELVHRVEVILPRGVENLQQDEALQMGQFAAQHRPSLLDQEGAAPVIVRPGQFPGIHGLPEPQPRQVRLVGVQLDPHFMQIDNLVKRVFETPDC